MFKGRIGQHQWNNIYIYRGSKKSRDRKEQEMYLKI